MKSSLDIQGYGQTSSFIHGKAQEFSFIEKTILEAQAQQQDLNRLLNFTSNDISNIPQADVTRPQYFEQSQRPKTNTPNLNLSN